MSMTGVNLLFIIQSTHYYNSTSKEGVYYKLKS